MKLYEEDMELMMKVIKEWDNLTSGGKGYESVLSPSEIWKTLSIYYQMKDEINAG